MPVRNAENKPVQSLLSQGSGLVQLVTESGQERQDALVQISDSELETVCACGGMLRSSWCSHRSPQPWSGDVQLAFGTGHERQLR